MAPSSNLQKSFNRWGARVTPLVLLALIGYSVWVEVVLIAVDYLLHSEARSADAIAIITLYFVLFIPTIVCYLRLLEEVIANPDYAPNPCAPQAAPFRKVAWRQSVAREENNVGLKNFNGPNSDRLPMSNSSDRPNRRDLVDGSSTAPQSLARHYERDVFECEIDGLPRWCSSCQNWKPDRSHHSKDVGRCVYKMDHFCPWAGGVVSETSYKFFVQFCTYGSVFNLYMLVVAAVYIAEVNKNSGFPNINWIVVLILSTLFFLFALGMSANGVRNILINSTVIDNLTARGRTQYFAVYIGPDRPAEPSALPHPPDGNHNIGQHLAQTRPYYPTITYPLPQDHPAYPGPCQNTVPPRTFAILKAPPDELAYKLATPMKNFQSVMGRRIWDWFLPIMRSPCCQHDAIVKIGKLETGFRELNMMYELGPTLYRMIDEAGLMPLMRATDSQGEHRRRRNRRRQSKGVKPEQRTEIGSDVPEGW